MYLYEWNSCCLIQTKLLCPILSCFQTCTGTLNYQDTACLSRKWERKCPSQTVQTLPRSPRIQSPGNVGMLFALCCVVPPKHSKQARPSPKSSTVSPPCKNTSDSDKFPLCATCVKAIPTMSRADSPDFAWSLYVEKGFSKHTNLPLTTNKPCWQCWAFR